MFITSRGCVYCVRGGGGGGAFVIDGLATGGCPPVIITSVSPSDRDIVQPVATLTRKKYVYVFGQAIGDVQISGIAMLGKNAQAGTMDRVVSFVRNHRVSNGSTSPVNVSMPGGAVKVWVTGMGVGTPDPEFNTIPFVINGLIAEPP